MGTISSHLGYHEPVPADTWACLARDHQSYYLPAIYFHKEHDERHALGMFKHCFFLFCLGIRDFDQYKNIYLYYGEKRLAKAEWCADEKVRLTFENEAIARKFDKSQEVIVCLNGHDGWKARHFSNRFGTLIGNDPHTRLWIRLRRSR